MTGASLGRADARRIPLATNSVDTIVTDPPYGIAFMGHEWDHFGQSARPESRRRKGTTAPPGSADLHSPAFIAYDRTPAGQRRYQQLMADVGVEMLRVAKPGATLLAFGGTRTWHRLACALEEAGWEIRDTLLWLQGEGMPKSHNLRGEFNGWGTQLRPAWEPIIMAMKAVDGTYQASADRWGVGGLAIAAARIATQGTRSRIERPAAGRTSDNHVYGAGLSGSVNLGETTLGRWPANVLMDVEAAADLDAQGPASMHVGGQQRIRRTGATSGAAQLSSGGASEGQGYGDREVPVPSRFYYVAKADRTEREHNLRGHLPCLGCGGLGTTQHVDDKGRAVNCWRNGHPTVKPLELMRYLCRLTATPGGGLVLDPFCGSGTTGIAALAEGRRFIGLDLDPPYLELAAWRLAEAALGMGL